MAEHTVVVGDETYVIGRVGPRHNGVWEETRRYRSFYMSDRDFVGAVVETAPDWFTKNKYVRADILPMLKKVNLTRGVDKRRDNPGLVEILCLDNYGSRDLAILPENHRLRYGPDGIEIRFPLGRFVDAALRHFELYPTFPVFDLGDRALERQATGAWANLLHNVTQKTPKQA